MALGFRKKKFLIKNRIRRILGKDASYSNLLKRVVFKEERNTPYLINQMCRIVCISTKQRQQLCRKITKRKINKKYRKNTEKYNTQKQKNMQIIQ